MNYDLPEDFLGGEAIEEVPLGPLTFNIRGRSERAGAAPETYILTPSRLADKLPPVINPDKIKVVPFSDDKPRSVEIVARIDIAGPVPFSSFTVLSGGDAAEVDNPAEQPEPINYGREEL